MSLSIGIVGLPNSGKSTLFNALLKRQVADVAEYPFTTVEPNTGVVEVSDERLTQLGKTLQIDKIVPAAVKFYDIAGLIKGAHEGEGLGNEFLNHIRQVDAILHLVRGFSSEKVPHVAGRIDPVHDINTINLELALADFELVKKTLLTAEKEFRAGKIDQLRLASLRKVNAVLEQGKAAREASLTSEEEGLVKDLNLLTLKPMIYGLNLDEAAVESFQAAPELPPVVLLSAKLEAEISQLPQTERQEYLKELGLESGILDRLIQRCFEVLELITFFTVKGGKQVQAWPLKQGKTVLEAAGMIHTDLKENFVKAVVINWQKLAKLGSWTKAKEAGKLRLAGKDYLVQEGEVMEIITH